MRTIIIGDIHGCSGALRLLLAKIIPDEKTTWFPGLEQRRKQNGGHCEMQYRNVTYIWKIVNKVPKKILEKDGKLVYKTKGISMNPVSCRNRDLVAIEVPQGRSGKYDAGILEEERVLKAYLKWLIPAVQAVITAALIWMLVSSRLLPGKYMAAAAVLVLALLALTCLLACRKNGAVRAAGSILGVFLCGMLLFGMVYVRHIMKTLDRIAGADTQIENIAVAVQDSNAAQEIAETSGYFFGVYEGADRENLEIVTEEIKEGNGDSELNLKYYDSPVEMAQDLLGGGLDAVICNKAYIDLLDDAVGEFSQETRIIYEREFEKEIEEAAAAESADKAEQPQQEETKAGTRVRGQKVTEHPFNILISGIDVSGPISTTSRSDVNIIMTVNPLDHRILLTTTPRDYYVYIPGISGENRDKLTHAGVYGIKTSMRTLENLYDIGISDYIRINFDSLIQLVDALGGVDVYSEEEFSSGEYYFVRGKNHLSGEEALAFSRSRHQFASGDNQRGQNQMLVLTAILDKLQSPDLLRDPSEVLDVVGRSMQTSFTSEEIAEVIAWQLDGGHGWDIGRQAVTGTGDSQQTFSMGGTDLYVMWPDEESVAKASEKIGEYLAE